MEELNIREKMVAPQFGDIITNGWASENNPTRVGYFVREGRRTGRMNPGRYFEVTDGAGKFWELPLDRDHKITVRPIALLSSAEAREEAQARVADWTERLQAICEQASCPPGLNRFDFIANRLAALQSAEARARELEARVEVLEKALRPFADAMFSMHTVEQVRFQDFAAARQALQQGERS